MSELFLVSYFVLWGLVLIGAAAIIQLFKRIAQPMHGETIRKDILAESERGIPAGQVFPKSELASINKGIMPLQGSAADTVLLITSVACQACEGIYPHIPAFLRKHPELKLVLLIDGAEEEIRDKLGRFKLDVPVYAIQPYDFAELSITVFPFGYYLRNDGTVAAKGVVSAPEHLELLMKHKDRAWKTAG